MKIRQFHIILDDGGSDVLHVRLEFDRQNKLEKFSLNYSTTIENSKKDVIRYDSSHGYSHLHRFYRKPPTTEKINLEMTISAVQQLINEIKENWKTWKKTFYQNQLEGV